MLSFYVCKFKGGIVVFVHQTEVFVPFTIKLHLGTIKIINSHASCKEIVLFSEVQIVIGKQNFVVHIKELSTVVNFIELHTETCQ